jgi:hypothetical protein
VGEEQKINQEEPAARCGLHRTYYRGVERRNVSLTNIDKIAEASSFGAYALDIGNSSDAE